MLAVAVLAYFRAGDSSGARDAESALTSRFFGGGQSQRRLTWIRILAITQLYFKAFIRLDAGAVAMALEVCVVDGAFAEKRGIEAGSGAMPCIHGEGAPTILCHGDPV